MSTPEPSARDAILARIRRGLADHPADTPVPWEYGRPTPMPDVLDRFVERCRDYRARVEVVGSPSVAHVQAMIVQVLADLGVRTVVLPAGLDPAWRQGIAAAGIAIRDDDPPLANAALNETDAVVTAARVAVAETGTIVLDHAADQGRRALSLVPDIHVCVVRADQVVSDVPEAVARLRESIDAHRPLTWISGGSATSDIELQRVEGVHGPRTLVVVLVR